MTPEVNEKMVMVPHGWWLPEMPAEEPSLSGVFDINVNMLIPMGYQGTSGYGGSPYKSMSCKVYRAEKGLY